MTDFIELAIAFVGLFIVGGILGNLFLPVFVGRFFISGFLFAVFGTGAGSLVIKTVFSR